MVDQRNSARSTELRTGPLTAEDLVESHRTLPKVDYAAMRDDSTDFFGTEDRIDLEPGTP